MRKLAFWMLVVGLAVFGGSWGLAAAIVLTIFALALWLLGVLVKGTKVR